MKFLIHSNGPNVPTGYGVQCALLVDRLTAAGHEVAVSCTYGNQAGVTTWTSPRGHKIRLYPSGYTTSSLDIVQGHAEHFFAGDPQAGWIVPLIDVWSMSGHPLLKNYQIAAWTPVDHDPAPPGVLQFFADTDARPIAMSRFGEAALRSAGLDPLYVPLAVDTTVYRPTWEINKQSSREFFGLPHEAMVVGMVAMNKDASDRKGFAEAFAAFARFQRDHPEAVLHLHTEQTGIAGGLHLPRLLAASGVRKGTYQFSDAYGYRLGFPPEIMAALYTSFDVLLAPSAGEGFCVPLIEAQACGVPVIAANWTAQPELVGAGWLVEGQPWWDETSRAFYQRPSVPSIVQALEKAWVALQEDDAETIAEDARTSARTYDADYVFNSYWRPVLAGLDDPAPPADKPIMADVAVLVPVLSRPDNVAPLVDSFNRCNDGTAALYFVVDPDDDDEIAAIKDAGGTYLVSDRGTSFACKLNSGYRQTTEPWLFVCGDDVEFTPGWIDPARFLSTQYDVIGTNDAEIGRTRNPFVADGSHADHFFVRRAYVDTEGACLDGPGWLAPEAYFHYFTDREIVQLAKATGRWTPCLDSRVIHHQPRYEGRPDLWDADPVYVAGGKWGEKDAETFRKRAPLVDERKTVKRGIW